MDLPITPTQISVNDFLDFLEINGEIRASVPSMLASPESFYRQFSIPKRSGGLRTVRSPYPSLSFVQQRLLDKILVSQPVHECAFAYRQGRNAIQNAAIHLKCDQLLTVDIVDFFHAVSRQMVFQVFFDSGLSPKFCQYAALLCCYEDGLPQGACTSPVLSNLAFYVLDNRLYRLAVKLNLNYSRYADDLAFSGKSIPVGLIKLIERILLSRRFRINNNKTKLKKGLVKKIITGVSIASGALKAPKSFKRDLRAQVYELELNMGNLATRSHLDPLMFERVIGRINYLLQIEPDNKYALVKKRSLSDSHQVFLSLVPQNLFDEILEYAVVST